MRFGIRIGEKIESDKNLSYFLKIVFAFKNIEHYCSSTFLFMQFLFLECYGWVCNNHIHNSGNLFWKNTKN